MIFEVQLLVKCRKINCISNSELPAIAGKPHVSGMRPSLGLTAKVKHDDHAMTWYDHGDSYSPWYDHGKIMEYI